MKKVKIYIDLDGDYLKEDNSLKDVEVSYDRFMESYLESLRNVKKEEINSIIVDSYLSVNAKKEEK